jgi:hypothetical protein
MYGVDLASVMSYRLSVFGLGQLEISRDADRLIGVCPQFEVSARDSSLRPSTREKQIQIP